MFIDISIYNLDTETLLTFVKSINGSSFQVNFFPFDWETRGKDSFFLPFPGKYA